MKVKFSKAVAEQAKRAYYQKFDYDGHGAWQAVADVFEQEANFQIAAGLHDPRPAPTFDSVLATLQEFRDSLEELAAAVKGLGNDA